MSKHTPGPWATRRNISSVGIVGADGFAVAACRFTGPDGSTTGETIGIGKANARLIAAAPDLLGALRDLLEAFDASPDDLPAHEYEAIIADARKRARAAIAKAEQS